MALFGSGKYSTLRVASPQARRMVIPDGSWVKCKKCSQTLYTERLQDNLQVCWCCGYHMPMPVRFSKEAAVNRMGFPFSVFGSKYFPSSDSGWQSSYSQ